ncbi:MULTISPECIES: MFS transporter [Corynebacterium]|uniref:MFS transporter n=1 Tax=Corynebacterium coyleae TaxID=53374 RepID=A0AAP6XLX5_9CORY|nr:MULTISPECIES: MFS transporter [Corynebacterium]MDK6494108.1 MFS transporter [Corynebacterium coyleae]MDK8242254.1 MFS transporter [Corynebacterium coyleae]MDK8663540.1 MFS transporter [Corynebacterium coyleae]MDK8706624.1 MFS transporter [Corynebacterium coyleae]MDK8733342.1 MFS transporter [Corynebacterium coyleae]
MRNEEANARRFIWSNGLQNIGDQVVAPKTVLPWLFNAAGVPAAFTSFLVPIRESGSMLPQAFLSPWVTSQSSRKRVWLIGSWGQALASAGIALSALLLEGSALGIAVIVLLAVHAVFRSICSIAGKDVQGRTISKGHRGDITGRATALAGGFTLAIGLALSFIPNELPQWSLAALLAGGASMWALASLVFMRIDEPTPDTDTSNGQGFHDMWKLVTSDRDLQRFLIVRSLMLVTALSTPFIVVLGSREGADLTGLGAFIVASGGASLLGGRVSGRLSDRSSKRTMAWAAGFASTVLILLVASAQLVDDTINAWVMPLGFFLVNLAHTAVRVSRKTYLVDMADGDRRTMITGAANTVMGIVLLVVGAISSAVVLLGPQAALIFLAVVGYAGVFGAANLKEVSANK